MQRIATAILLTVLLSLHVCGQSAWKSLLSGTTKNLWSIQFVSKAEGWAAGDSATLLHTTDGGTTWSAVSTPAPAGTIFCSVSFDSANNGWVGGGYYALRSSNNGASWSQLTTSYYIYSLFPISSSQCWVVSSGTLSGYIARFYRRYTFDQSGGVSTYWQGYTGASYDYDIYFVTADDGWSVGAGGRIMRISSASSSSPVFTTQSSGTTELLGDIQMLDANNGWVVGNVGTILRTTNGGTSWTPQTSGITTRLWDIYFTDLNNGWAVGSDGVLLRTTNGGVAWTAQQSGVTSILRSVFFADTTAGWACGDNGVIIKLESSPPAVPALVSPAKGATGISTNPLLVWSPSSGASTYRLQVASNPDFSPTTVDQSALSGVSQQLSGLVNGRTYYWRVSATGAGGSSPFSAPWSFATIVAPPPAPALVTPPDSATNLAVNPTLKWNRVSGATAYWLQVAQSSAFEMTVINDSTMADTAKVVGPLQNAMTYFWRVRAKNDGGTGGWSVARSFATAVAVFDISGTARYGSAGGSPIGDITVVLAPSSPGTSTARTDAQGAFRFEAKPAGSYTLSFSKSGGHPTTFTNAADALKAALFSVDSSQYPLAGICRTAADVNGDGNVNSADALQIMLRYVGMTSAFTKGDWVFTPASASLMVVDQDATRDVIGMAVGDLNGDAQPGGEYFAKRKEAQSVHVQPGRMRGIGSPGVFEVPVAVKRGLSIGSVSFSFQYHPRSVRFSGVRGPDGTLSALKGSAVVVAWMNPHQALELKENDVLLRLCFENQQGGREFDVTLDPSSQITDAAGNLLSNVEIELPRFDSSVPAEFALGQNFPNPFNPGTTFTFSLPRDAHIVLKVISVLGEEVASIVSGNFSAGTYTVGWNPTNLASGVYFYRLQARPTDGHALGELTPAGGQAEEYIQTRKLILAK